MDDTLPVSAIERHATLEDNADYPMHGHQLINPDEIFKRATLDVLHRQIGIIVFNHGIKHPNDIGVIHALRNHAFILKKLAHTPRHGGAVLAKLNQLDGNLTIRFRVVTEVDRSSRPLAQLADDPISAYRFHAEPVSFA